MQMLGSFAEFEREMIRERTHGGPAGSKTKNSARPDPFPSGSSSI